MGSRSKEGGWSGPGEGWKERGEDEMSQGGGRIRIEVDGSKSDGLRVDFWMEVATKGEYYMADQEIDGSKLGKPEEDRNTVSQFGTLRDRQAAQTIKPSLRRPRV